MTQTTTIKAGETAKTITLPEGFALIIAGHVGAIGVAYHLDPVLGGTNSLKTWTIGAGALPAPIGPFANSQKIHITCQAGVINATVQDAVLTATGGSVAAVLTGSGIVGEKVTATLPAGVIGTLQFTKTLKASPFTKSNIATAVANAVNSLQYTLQQADLPYDIGCDASNTISPSNKISASAASSSNSAPAVITAASITGTPAQNVPLALTATAFSGNPTPTVTRVIRIAGSIVASGPAGSTGYTPSASDVGKIPTYTDTATNSEGSAESTGTGAAIAAAASVPMAPVLESVVGFKNRADVNVRKADNDTANITGFRVTATPGNLTAEKSGGGPGVITVQGLTNGTEYSFVAEALYAAGKGPASSAAVATPVASRQLHCTRGGVAVYDGVHGFNTAGSIVFEVTTGAAVANGVGLGFKNASIVGGIETGGSGTDTWSGSVEIANSGTLLQLTAATDGATTISVPTKTVAYTAKVGGAIPKGTLLRFRLNTVQPGKIKFWNYGDGDGKTRQKFATTAAGAPDITMQVDQSSLTLVGNEGGPLILPFLIFGDIDCGSLVFNGDSISVARGDIGGSTVGRGYMGRAAHALGVPYAQLGKSGDTLKEFVGSNSIRRAAQSFFTHAGNDNSTNDVTSDQTAAQISSNRTTVIGYNAGKPQIWFNIIPNVLSSSDGYTTVAGQALRPQEAVRLAVNAELAAGVPGVRVIDINAAMSAPGDVSRHRVGPNGEPFVLDGAHPTAYGASVGAASYDLSTFIKPM